MGEWTLEALYQYLELRISELEKRLLGERELLVASTAARAGELERRLATLNDLRNEVMADRALFVTRDTFQLVLDRLSTIVVREYYDEQHRALAEKVDISTAAIATMRARSAAYAAAVALSLTILTAIVLIIQVGHK